ncbi:MAG TPA: hypothetical protein VJ746_01300 [Nitrospira sp.]|nr:hypothetical protein [Nitrospira sp.]
MPQRTRLQQNYSLILLLVSIVPVLGVGCAGPTRDPEVALLHEAQEEKAAASLRLAKAITRYCSATAASLDARHACIVDRRLAVPEINQPPMPTGSEK